VLGIGRRVQDDALVRAVCRMGADLGLTVVAEGVETAAQATTLVELGCRLAQGYRFQPPTPISMIRQPAARRELPRPQPADPVEATWPPEDAVAS